MTPSALVIGASLVGVGFLIGLSGALIPGPLFAFVVSETLKKGEKGALSGPLTMIGHFSVELPLIVGLVVLGLELEKYFGQFERWIFLLGGVALILMSFFVVKESREARSRASKVREKEREKEREWEKEREREGEREQEKERKYNSTIFGGFLLTALNPSFLPWWFAVGYPVLLSGFKWLALKGIVLVVFGHFLSDFAWYSFVSVSFSRGRNFFVGRRYELAMLVVAVFLVVLGVLFVVRGLGK